jgi:hypothetical protein
MITAGYGIIIVVRWFWWRVNAWGEITALGVSGISSTVLSPKFAAVMGITELIPQMEWSFRFMIVVFLCTVSWIIVCLITPPTSEIHLKRFCEKVKPFPTFWGPIYRKYPEIEWNPHFIRACFHWIFGALAIYSFCFGLGSLLFKGLLTGGLLLLSALGLTLGIVLTRK